MIDTFQEPMQVGTQKFSSLSGLSEEQVRVSRERHGNNALRQAKRQGVLSKFFENFGDPIIKILLVAFGINLIFSFNDAGWYETIGIALAILLATWMSTVSMHQSEEAFQKLQAEASNTACRVIRDGRIRLIPAIDIVVKDMVMLQSGERVPADGTIVGGELDVDQSALNGETKEAHKVPGKVWAGNDGNMKNPERLFSGSVVCAGEGVMRVEAVGDGTFLGKLAAEIQEDTRESPLKIRLTSLAGSISKLGTIGAGLVTLADLFNIWVIGSGFSLPIMMALLQIKGFAFSSVLHAITLAVTVIVVAVPEGLPMMITVVLSANMRHMLKDNVLVRNMVGIETAGNLDILFTDKTGTLTQGKFQVARICRGADGQCAHAADACKDQEYWKILHTSLWHNNASKMSDGVPVGGNTTDRALLAFAAEAPDPGVRILQGKSLPFTSEKKYMATEVTGDLCLTLVKGAPERILPHIAKAVDVGGREVRIPSPSSIERAAKTLAGEGMRVLAVATSPLPLDSAFELKDLTLVALMGIYDPLRNEAEESVRTLNDAGIQVVMVTGDGVDTATSIGRGAGLLNDKRALVMTSKELNALNDARLSEVLPDLRIVARALPGDKSRLVDIAQQRGSVVAMTGDGVNDSPALKKADVGFTMGSGTEVAKEAGDVVILDDNLSSIVKAVLYGRTIFRTIRKFIVFQLTVNVCAVGISIIAPLIGYDAPVTVLQMLWINMVMDTLAGLAFSGEPALKRYLRAKPLHRDTPIISREMVLQIIVMGTFTMVLCLWFLLSPNVRTFFRSDGSDQVLMTAFFAVFMYAGIFNSVSARTDSLNLFDHILGNKGFVFVMAFVFLAQTALIFFGGSLFRVCGLTLIEWLTTIALSSLVIPADLIRKAAIRIMAAKK